MKISISVILIAIVLTLCVSSQCIAASGDSAAKQGLRLFAAGDYRQALAYLETAARCNPPDLTACYYCAICNQKIGNNQRALQLYEYLSRVGGANPVAEQAALSIRQLRGRSSPGAHNNSATDGKIGPGQTGQSQTAVWNVSSTQGVIRPRVLVLNFDPSTGSGRFHSYYHWNDPRTLIQGFVSAIKECSHGSVDYQITTWKDIDSFPPKIDGYRPSAAEMIAAAEREHGWTGQGAFHQPAEADYIGIAGEQHLLESINQGAIDEVWMISAPCAGFFESRMLGPGAYFCNSPPLKNVATNKVFVMMGFNYERGIGEMLESYGHRAESILTHVYGRFQPTLPYSELNTWERFALYDKLAPGKAAVGLLHFAPNSLTDYDWGRRTAVSSTCDDWLNYPRLTGQLRTVDCRDWGNGEIEAHHMWWFNRVPHASGASDGRLNNWWCYIADFNRYSESR